MLYYPPLTDIMLKCELLIRKSFLSTGLNCQVITKAQLLKGETPLCVSTCKTPPKERNTAIQLQCTFTCREVPMASQTCTADYS